MKEQLPLGHHSVLAQFAREYGGPAGGRVVEVGVHQGRTANHVLDEVPTCRLWAVDPWAPYDQSDAQHSGRPYGMVTQEDQEESYGHAIGRLKEHISTGRCHVLRMPSLQAAVELAGGEKFDVVFIDADHRREPVFADCVAWWPLVRKGGILCGHDLGSWDGVAQGIGDFMDHASPGLDLQVYAFNVWGIIKP